MAAISRSILDPFKVRQKEMGEKEKLDVEISLGNLVFLSVSFS